MNNFRNELSRMNRNKQIFSQKTWKQQWNGFLEPENLRMFVQRRIVSELSCKILEQYCGDLNEKETFCYFLEKIYFSWFHQKGKKSGYTFSIWILIALKMAKIDQSK